MPDLHRQKPNTLQRLSKLACNQKLRFILVGGWNTIAGYLIFVAVQLLIGQRIGTMLTLIVSYMIALPVAFILQRYFVFIVKDRLSRQFLRFTLANSTIFALNLIFLPVLVFLTKASPLVMQAVFVVMSAIISYFAHKYFSFAR
jgi:putative flippase GtrA